MQELCGNEIAYTSVWMKFKLNEHYGEQIVLTESQGKSNVVTFRKTASSILLSFYTKGINNQTEEEEKMKIIKTAAELIRSDISAMETNKETYPTAQQISSLQDNLDFIPNSLQLLLNTIAHEYKPNLKVASIGQATIQMTRPRSILCPLQLALGIQMHRQFGSRFLIETLFSLGLSSSYSEIQKYEACAAVEKSEESVRIGEDVCMQFVADNVDHNSDTIDGKNTFHGMGMISCMTPIPPKGSFGRRFGEQI